jgi:SPP1 gp7 family putative phage head morphogenesis protein
MAIPFKAGRVGTPLTADEIAMAQTLADAIAGATNALSLQEIVALLGNLSPIEIERLLNSITIFQNSPQIQQSILDSINIGGNEAISALHGLAPNLAVGAFDFGAGSVIPNTLANMDFASLIRPSLATMPRASMKLRFNMTNPNSLAYASSRAGELVTSIDELTRQSIRNIIQKGFAQQIDVQTLALQIKNVIGLHPQWADAVVNFQRRETERLLKTGLNDVSARAQVATSTARYAERLKQARATTIARTEVQIANNQGRWEGWNQANDNGYIDQATTKTWIVAPDERTCDSCMELEGETVAWDDVFSNGSAMPPKHPNCRCQAHLNPPNRGTT